MSVLKRVVAVGSLIAAGIMPGVAPAQAATGPW
jgi:hypothetical protein